MKFIQTPVKGMQDFLPEDMVLREHVLGIIRDTYAKYGFTEIETPVMEHIENLTGKTGERTRSSSSRLRREGVSWRRLWGKCAGVQTCSAMQPVPNLRTVRFAMI